MRTAAHALAFAFAATPALAQISPSTIAAEVLSFLSNDCASAVTTLVTNSSFSQCLQLPALEPAFNTSTSVIPDVDAYLTAVCASSSPCSNETLTEAASVLLGNCSADFARFGISNATVDVVFELYPLAREIACLKTETPLNATTANVTFPTTNATASSLNTTNGTFCLSALATELSTYLGANLTDAYILTAALGGNATTVRLLEAIPPTALCSDCVVAALDLVEQYFPAVGNLSLSVNGTNYTLNSLIDTGCAAYNLSISANGTLPATIDEVAVNSTYPFNVTYDNTTYVPTSTAPVPLINGTAVESITSAVGSAVASATGALSSATAIESASSEIFSIAASATSAAVSAASDVAAVKRRWIGQRN
ncbi:hypothetical protein Q5752_002982 [Cryptotrichosporon argae]